MGRDVWESRWAVCVTGVCGMQQVPDAEPKLRAGTMCRVAGWGQVPQAGSVDHRTGQLLRQRQLWVA